MTRTAASSTVILVRGLEDLPDNPPLSLDKKLDIIVFNSDWRKSESFSEKIGRFHSAVSKAKAGGGEIIVIGVSAGAGLAESYMLKYPGMVDRLYSLLGVLQPDLADPKITRLCKESTSFTEMVKYLSSSLTPSAIAASQLHERIIAFSSPGDTVVPQAYESPSWVKNKTAIGNADHLPTIIRLLMHALPHLIKRARGDT